MTQPATLDPQSLQDLEVIDNRGDKVGKVNVVLVDSATGRPEWAAVKTGLFGGHVTLVPLSNALVGSNKVTVAYTKDAIKDAPNHDPDVELSSADKSELLRYYGLSVINAPNAETAGHDSSGHDTSDPNTDDAMTRSEERTAVGTEQVQTGTARLRKFIIPSRSPSRPDVTRRGPRRPRTDHRGELR